jgi:membrane fusion protein, multidrug efflux system
MQWKDHRCNAEDDYLKFQRDRASHKSALANKVDIALSDEHQFVRRGILNFLDKSLDRASGTIHARATVPNSDLLLTPGEYGLRVIYSGLAPSDRVVIGGPPVTPGRKVSTKAGTIIAGSR